MASGEVTPGQKSSAPKRPIRREIFRAGAACRHTGADTTLFVGDQLFTDVWGAKKCGIMTYLTKPIHPKEEIQIVLKRYLEKIVLFFYHREKRRKGNQNAE